MDEQQEPHKAPSIARSDSSSASSVDHADGHPIHAPVPTRPRLPSRKSSGTLIVDRNSSAAVGLVETRLEPGDVRAMSPRRTGEDLETLGRETKDELRK